MGTLKIVELVIMAASTLLAAFTAVIKFVGYIGKVRAKCAG
jgi:hypothetical protein